MNNRNSYFIILALVTLTLLGMVGMGFTGNVLLMFSYPIYLVGPLAIAWMIKNWHQQDRDIQYLPKEIALKTGVLVVFLTFYFLIGLHEFLAIPFQIICYEGFAVLLFAIGYDALLYQKLKRP